MLYKGQLLIFCFGLLCYVGPAFSDTKGKAVSPIPTKSIPLGGPPPSVPKGKTAPPIQKKSLSSKEPSSAPKGKTTFPIRTKSFSSKESSSPLKGKITKVTFDKALPEDISNENFPDRIDSFDFPNANLLDLVKAISKLTGINFIVDPNLKSKKISIISPSSITVAEAYKAFLSALAANNYTVVKSGAFWKIKKSEDAHSDNIEVYSGDYFPNTDQLITRIIKLKHINAKNFSTSIKWLLSKENKDRISAYEGSNSIILSDYGSVIERIMKIVYEMDVPGSEETVEIIPIQHASAEELSGLLIELLSINRPSSRSAYNRPRGKSRMALSPNVKKSSSGNVKISTIVSDSRTNSLVVSANESGLERVYTLVKKLDTPVDAGRTGGVYVYNVLYGTAEEIYNTLMGIKPSSKQSNKQNRQDVFSQPKSSRPRSFSSFGRRTNNSPLFDESVGILSDTNTNSLIISAKSKYDYERVLSVLKKIDVPRDQVFIQAIIIEMLVSKGNSREFNLAGAVGNLFENSFLAEIGFKNILGSSIAGFLSQSFGLDNLKPAGIGPGLILSAPLSSFLSDSQGTAFPPIDSVVSSERAATIQSRRDDMYLKENRLLRYSQIPLLKMLKTATNINILSTPQLTTLDNVKAFIEVGENAPVGLTSTATAGALAQNSVDREDITLRLDILPRINPESGTVQMDITQKFDDFSDRNPTASELAARSVNIVKRQIKTKMVLNDGETAVLGGLLTDKEIQKDNKVPLLGDLPVIGWLFKGSSVQKEKRNLMVFITPTIIKGEIHKEKTKEILGKKLEERIQFIKQNAKGTDPHGITLKKLISEPESFLNSNKKSEMEQNSSFEKTPEQQDQTLPIDEFDFQEIVPDESEELRPEDYSPALPEEDPSPGTDNEFLEESEVEDSDYNPIPSSPENF